MVKVILKTFDILEFVARRNSEGVTLTEISKELELNQATTANIINTIVAKGYFEHIGKKKGYRLGPAAFRLTNEVAYGQDLVDAARDVMEDVATKVNESCILGILKNYKRYILHVVNSSQEVQVQVRTERNVYETASGRLLMAYLSEKELERFIQQNGLPDKKLWQEASTPKGLTETLSNIKKEGIAMTYLKERHVRGFAVPIIVHGQAIAGLSVFLPDYRYSATKHKEIVKALNEASVKIAKKLQVIG